MKNSAWYHKLWRNKADEYPVREDAHSSWQEMQQLLDEHMPVAKTSGGKKPGKSVGSTIVSMLGFILPAAAMIGTITFVAVKHSFKHKPVIKQQQQHVLRKQGDNALTDSTTVSTDSVLSATAPHADIQAENTSKGPGQLAALNVTTASSGHTQSSGSSSAGNTAKHIAVVYQPNSPLGVVTYPEYSTLEYPRQPANLFTIEIPDTLQSNYPLWQKITGGSIINLPELANYQTTGRSDRDGIIVNNADEQSGSGSPSGRDKRSSKTKIRAIRYKAPRSMGDSTRFGIGLYSGLNWSGGVGNLFAGLALSYHLQNNWLLNTGVTLNIHQLITSNYSHASFAPRDTNVSFQIRDQRVAQVVTIPLTLEYAISKLISISAGPQISIASQPKRVVKSSEGRSAYILNVPNRIDTLNHGHSIDTALNLTTLNKINIGLSGGVSVHLNRHLHIDARYQQNITPYQFNNSYLGNSKVYYHSVQVGLCYQFGN